MTDTSRWIESLGGIPSAAELAQHWYSSLSDPHLTTPIGKKVSADPTAGDGNPEHSWATLEISMHNQAHVLVIGSTGSGKSTIVRAAFLGLAARYSPDRVQFVLGSFKGTRSHQPLASLPHTAIDIPLTLDDRDGWTDLTDVLTAEQYRRIDQITAAGGDGISGYRQLAAAGQVEPLPDVLILVDHELTEIGGTPLRHAPVFSELLSTGPTLGMHLVLTGTDVPQNFHPIIPRFGTRICTGVRSPADSLAVLGTDEASAGDMLARRLAYQVTTACPAPALLQPVDMTTSWDAEDLTEIIESMPRGQYRIAELPG